jgi:hypothetical protein
MKMFHGYLKALPTWCGVALFCLLPVCGGFAQSANALHVEIDFVPRGCTNFQARTEIRMDAFVSMDGPRQEGDSVKVEFFANAKSLGKKTSYWHPERRPPSRPGFATPMWIMPPQFDSVPLVWKNPPAGNYAMTARAMFSKMVKAVSIPVNIVVSP